MLAIYAFYSKPFGSVDIRRARTHWAITHVEFTTLAYSVLKSKQYGFRTVLFCDRYGRELICNTFGIEFDEVLQELDFCEVKPRFWAAGKIYAYTKGLESLGGFQPFMLVDNDAGWHKQPPAHFLSSRYRCQSIHTNRQGILLQYLQKIVTKTKNEFPFDIFHEAYKQREGFKGGNAGMVIMNDERLWSEFTKYSWALMQSSFFDYVVKESRELNPYKSLNMWNVIIEECLLLQLSRRINHELPQTILESEGFSIQEGTRNDVGYFHIWGNKKNAKFLNEFEQKIIPYIPESIVNKIHKYFNYANSQR